MVVYMGYGCQHGSVQGVWFPAGDLRTTTTRHTTNIFPQRSKAFTVTLNKSWDYYCSQILRLDLSFWVSIIVTARSRMSTIVKDDRHFNINFEMALNLIDWKSKNTCQVVVSFDYFCVLIGHSDAWLWERTCLLTEYLTTIQRE